MFTTTSRKVLVPLATLVAAGAVAVGSGATFTSTTDSAITATAGILEHSNSSLDDATLDITNLKPGGTAEGTLTITNVGTLDSTLKVIPSAPTAGLGALAPALEITIEGESGSAGYNGSFAGAVDVDGFALGDLDASIVDVNGDPSDSITVTVTVTMLDSGDDTDNQYQGETAGLDLKFVTTQTGDDDESLVDGWNL